MAILDTHHFLPLEAYLVSAGTLTLQGQEGRCLDSAGKGRRWVVRCRPWHTGGVPRTELDSSSHVSGENPQFKFC